MPLTTTTQWRKLEGLAATFSDLDLRDLFAADTKRANRLTLPLGDLVIDLSKNLLTTEILNELVGLASQVGLVERIAAMLRGERINTTENRAVLHTALRAAAGTAIELSDDCGATTDVVSELHRLRARMTRFCEQVRDGLWLGVSGKPIKTVINIGIGGSDLGPAMAYEALVAFRHPRLRCRFVSNVDGTDLLSALAGLDPATTMFIVASKTFTTAETLMNAGTARRWLAHNLGEQAVAQHFVAVSAAPSKVAEFGIETANCFEMWDWVGGRYSLASAIGLSLMLAIGPPRFEEMLSGMRLVDEHFATAPLARNVPVVAGLTSLWYRTFCDLPTRAVLPYAQALQRFPAYLQQLEMESNGKTVRSNGALVDFHTAPIVWGAAGTNAQHSFHQMLHQGSTIVPVDFIVFANPDCAGLPDFANPGQVEILGGAELHNSHHEALVANCLAQGQALAFGKTSHEVAATGTDPALIPHRTFKGNRPSTTILAKRLTPSVLGQLIAYYEHQTFTQGMVWGINSFDQWGVELGKSLATEILAELRSSTLTTPGHDPSTNALISHYRRLSDRRLG